MSTFIVSVFRPLDGGAVCVCVVCVCLGKVSEPIGDEGAAAGDHLPNGRGRTKTFIDYVVFASSRLLSSCDILFNGLVTSKMDIVKDTWGETGEGKKKASLSRMWFILGRAQDTHTR